MIFLLNREYVLWEIVELARLHMAEVLKVPASAIEAELDLGKEVLSPEFRIDADLCKGVTAEEIKAVMSAVYADCKVELYTRFIGINMTRKEYLERYCWNDEEEAKETGQEEAASP